MLTLNDLTWLLSTAPEISLWLIEVRQQMYAYDAEPESFWVWASTESDAHAIARDEDHYDDEFAQTRTCARAHITRWKTDA